MACYSNLNFNFPSFGALTFGASFLGCSSCSWMPTFNNISFMSNPFSFNYSMPVFSAPMFNFGDIWNNFNFNNISLWNFNFSPTSSSSTFSNFWDSYSGDTFTHSSSGSSSSSHSGNTNYARVTTSGGSISIEGYNSSAGLKLANAGLKRGGNSTRGGGICATKVREALQETGLYTGHTISAADYIGILSKPGSHFKQISTSGINVASLPAGCILVYGRGVAGYSRKHGHIEITTGDGRAVSDFVHKVRKTPTAIFVPV